MILSQNLRLLSDPDHPMANFRRERNSTVSHGHDNQPESFLLSLMIPFYCLIENQMGDLDPRMTRFVQDRRRANEHCFAEQKRIIDGILLTISDLQTVNGIC